jgi:IS30 family transposase
LALPNEKRFRRRHAIELFRRFKAGERFTDIALSLGSSPGSVHGVFARYGGIEPKPQIRAQRALTCLERDEISRGLAAKDSMRCIAERLGRAPSTLCREIQRNDGVELYRASTADTQAWKRALRPKACKLQQQPVLAALVAQKLKENFSPQQISAWLRTDHTSSPELRVSPETIYRTLFVQARGALKKELLAHLRRSKSIRRTRQKKLESTQATIPDLISIRERPAEVEDRAVPGHWEGDLIAGRNNRSHIGTLVERKTRYVKLVRIESKNAPAVAKALAREVMHLPEQLRLSLTWDRGTEMADHKSFTVETNVHVYFCDPHSPWQRGSNENTNGLLRQYFPKGTDLSGFTQSQLDAVARQLNARPRMTLGWKTPAQALKESVAATG